MINKKNRLDADKWTLEDIKKLFKNKSFALPPIQRDFVWDKRKILNLLDSIRKHYPIGSFLVCKIPTKDISGIKEDSLVIPLFDKDKNPDYGYLIIDGQQRLSVLYSVLFRTEIPTNRYKDSLRSEMIYLSPRKGKDPEFEFYYQPPRGDYLKVCDIFDNNADIPKHKKILAKECREAFESYLLPYVEMKKYEAKNMKEAFDRLNRGGTKLSTYDTLMCFAEDKEIKIKQHINNLREHPLIDFKYLRKIEQHILNSIAVNLGWTDFFGKSMESFAKKLANPHDKSRLHQNYKKLRKNIEKSICKAAGYLKSNFANDVSFLPYPAMLTILSVFYYSHNNKKPNPHQSEQIEKWFWVTGFTRRYSGINQRKNQMCDVEEMRKLATDESYVLNLEKNTSKSTFDVRSLRNLHYNSGSVLRDTFFCYLFSMEPLDFYSGKRISLEKDLSSKLDLKNKHHVFPRKFMQGHGYQLKDINPLVNICLLDFSENIDISDDPPWVYLKRYSNKNNFHKILKSHAIPKDTCILHKGDVRERYKNFKKEREEFIRKDLEMLMGKKYLPSDKETT